MGSLRKVVQLFPLLLAPLFLGVVGCGQPGAGAAGPDGSSGGGQARAGVAIYEAYCFACHDYGAAGAPRIDSPDQWSDRLELGVAALMLSVEAGLGVMPRKGSCFDCSAQELTAAVEYMLRQVQPSQPDPLLEGSSNESR